MIAHAGPSIADIKGALQARVRDLVFHLAPGGIEKQGVYKPLNPTRADRRPGSFVIWTSRGTAGAWTDYATGEKGDILQLVGYCLGLDTAQSLQWAKVWTGLDRGPLPEAHRKVRPASAVPVDEEARRGRLRRQAKAMWLAGGTIQGTLAARYLASRGIALGALARPPHALRYVPLLEWVGDRSTQHWPAIVACMVREDIGICAVHRTYIARDGDGKAAIEPNRKVYGDVRGAVIPIARGQSGFAVKEACAHGIADTLVLTEGIEDALAVALAEPDARVWAAYSLNNLAAIRLPDCVQEVIVFADNDWSQPQAMAALDRAVEALSSQGRPVRVARASVGKDANDLLNAGG